MVSKRTMGWIGVACLCVWAGGVRADPPAGTEAEAGDEPDVVELLKKADAATRAVRAVEYEGEVFGVGAFKDRVHRIKGTLKVKPGKRSLLDTLAGRSSGRQVMRFDGTITPPGADEPITLKIATDGKRVQCINETEKTFVQGESAQLGKLLDAVNTFYMREYLFPTPFSDEIEAKIVRYEGAKRVGKVKCDVIFVVYQNDSQSRWYFGQEDHLPRRVDRIVRTVSLWGGRKARDDTSKPREEAAYVIKITSLNTTPTFTGDDFILRRPKGFESRSVGPDEGKEEESPNLLTAGTEAPDWELADADGKTVSLKSLRGKVVLMEFWATWCGPSKLSMPAMQELHERFKDKPVVVLGVNVWERDGDPVEFMRAKKYTYGLLLKGEKAAEAYQVHGTPTFYVIGPDGKILYASAGYEPRTEEDLTETIEKSLEHMERDQSNH